MTENTDSTMNVSSMPSDGLTVRRLWRRAGTNHLLLYFNRHVQMNCVTGWLISCQQIAGYLIESNVPVMNVISGHLRGSEVGYGFRYWVIRNGNFGQHLATISRNGISVTACAMSEYCMKVQNFVMVYAQFFVPPIYKISTNQQIAADEKFPVIY